jgi:type IV pilus assembly protein PilA
MNAVRTKPIVAIIVLIVVLVVISAFAVSAWRSHQIRSHVADALKVSDTAKLVVMESATVHGGLAHIEASDLTYNPQATVSKYVAQITIDPDGRIHLATKGTGASPDPVLLLTPSEHAADNGAAPIQWSCEVVTGDSDLVPDDCRAVEPAATTSRSPADAASIAGASSSHSP